MPKSNILEHNGLKTTNKISKISKTSYKDH